MTAECSTDSPYHCAMSDIDHYLVLGVGRGATRQEIEKAFKRVSTQTYSLLGGGGAGGKRTARIEEAYAVLRDSERRAAYDRRAGGGERP